MTSDAEIISGNVEYWAEKCIELQEGFEVKSDQGAEFLADISPGLDYYFWTIKDHKGNVRSILDDNGNVKKELYNNKYSYER